MRRAAAVIIIMLLLASSGCAAYRAMTATRTCCGKIAREALVSGAQAISAATRGQLPRLVEADCDGWSSEAITYPGIPKEDVTARIRSLPFCTEHSQNTQTWWQCYFSGSTLDVEIAEDDTLVRVRVGVAP